MSTPDLAKKLPRKRGKKQVRSVVLLVTNAFFSAWNEFDNKSMVTIKKQQQQQKRQ